MKRLRIFLVDDHVSTREGLKHRIGAQPDMEVIGETGDSRAALEEVARLRPDVLVADISMPELNGAHLVRRLKTVMPELRVVVHTRHDDTGHVNQMLAAGASGYMLKSSDLDEIMLAIRKVARGDTYIDSGMQGKLLSNLAGRPARGEIGGRLSPSEERVLRLASKGYLNKEIAEQLGISVKTVENTKDRGMKSLGLKSRVELVRHAFLQGWLEDN